MTVPGVTPGPVGPETKVMKPKEFLVATDGSERYPTVSRETSTQRGGFFSSSLCCMAQTMVRFSSTTVASSKRERPMSSSERYHRCRAIILPEVRPISLSR